MRVGPFVPTHLLKYDYAEGLHLPQGTPLRQINPFTTGDLDHRMCLDENDWNGRRRPWIFLSSEIEPLPNWPEERQKMIDRIMDVGSHRPLILGLTYEEPPCTA